MQFTYGGSTYRLEAGDCLALHMDEPIEFRNPTRQPARYPVVLMIEAPRRPVMSASQK